MTIPISIARRLLRTGLLLAAVAPAVAAETVALAKDGQALQRVVVAEAASERVQAAAATLADYLGRIAGAKFEVATGDGKSGIAVGTGTDFPALPFAKSFDPTTMRRREEYLLRTHAAGAYLVGATELAVEHAVWDLLDRLGYRQFFPSPEWEIVPKLPTLTASVDVRESPDFHTRRIWFGYGTWRENMQAHKQWCARNRAVGAMKLQTGHAYGGIIGRMKKEFAAHPEYFSLIDGERRPKRQGKFCISNPGLRQLVVDYAFDYFERRPEADSISLDPSDGSGWCQCEPCVAMGSVSDRVVLLANQVATALEARLPGKTIGFYAYNRHSPPPTVRLHPNIVVSVATAFIRGGYTFDQLVEGWQKQGATIGVRGYFSVFVWDHDIPGRARGSRPRAVAASIAKYHGQGARFISEESSDNWGPNGLGYYVAARVLWDVGAAERVEAIIDDFLDKAFGPAQAPMREFYQLINGGSAPMLSSDMIGRMYRHLDAALKLTDDPAVRARVHHLVLYTRYVELYAAYRAMTGPARLAGLEAVIRHAYRQRSSSMLHTKGLYREAFRDSAAKVPPEARWNLAEKDNPWKSSEPFAAAELAAFVEQGIAAHQLRGFDAVEFSAELVKTDPLGLPPAPALMPPTRHARGRRDYFTWIDEAPATLEMTLTDGLIEKYRDRGDAKIGLRPLGQPDQEPTSDARVPPDGEPRQIKLTTPHLGLHAVNVSDGKDASLLEWQEGRPMTLLLDLRSRLDYGPQGLYFYVPKSTSMIGGYARNVTGVFKDADGKEAHVFGPKAGYFKVPVPPAQRGRLWTFHGEFYKAKLMLMNVPPYMARSPGELLLPKEVVQADARQK